MSDDTVNVKIGAQIEGALSAISELKASFTELGEAVAVAFSVEAVIKFVEGMTALAVETQRTAAILGTATENVSGLSIAAEASGGSLEGMTKALERFGMNLAKGAAGNQQVVAGLNALGLSAREFQGLSIDETLGKLANAFAHVKDGLDKVAIAQAVGGRGFANMIPTLNQGAAAFEEFRAMAERAGSSMSEAVVEGFEKTHQATIELSKSLQGVGITVMSAFKPAIDGIVKTLIDVVQGFNNAMKAGGTLADTLKGIVIVVQIVVSAFVVLIQTIKQLWAVLNLAADGLYVFAATAGKAISELASGHFSAAKDAVSNFGSEMGKVWTKYTAAVIESNKTAASEMSTIWGTAAHGHEKIEQDSAAKLKLINKDGVAAAMSAIESQIKIEQEALKTKTALLDGEAKLHQITEDQKFAALMNYTEKAYQAELALLHKEADLDGLNLKQKQDILGKIAQLTAKHDTDMVKLDQQAAQASTKVWSDHLSSLSSSFNAQLRGMLAGTTSFATAAKTIAGDMVIHFIEYFEKMGIEWLAGQLGMTTAATTGAAARVAAETTAGKAGSATAYAETVAQIGRNAVAVFGGVFANLAPLLGPAAAGPAAASQAAVVATIGEVPPPFEQGAWRIPGTMQATLHQDEVVLPKPFADDYRDNASGGSGGSVTINAIDAKSIKNLLQENSAIIGQIVEKYARNNPGKK